MARPQIKTCREFEYSLHSIPYAAARLGGGAIADRALTDMDMSLEPYRLWHSLLELVHAAMDDADWPAVASLLALYDGVERAGPDGEMYEASYVAFLEDVHLPKDPARLRAFWEHSPPAFVAALKSDRGIR